MVANKQHSKAGRKKPLKTARQAAAKGGGFAKRSAPVKRATPGGSAPHSLCPVSQECGACQLIDVPYEQQLAAKDAEIARLYEGLCSPSLIKPTLGMADPFHYRNKVMSPFAPGGKLPAAAGKGSQGKGAQGKGARDEGGRFVQSGKVGKGTRSSSARSAPRRDILCGMYTKGTHHIIDSSCCLLENEQAKAVVQAVRSIMLRYGMEPYDEDRGTGFVRHVVVRVGHTSGEVLVTLVSNSEEFPSSRAFCRELVRRCPFVTTVVQNINTLQTNVVLGEQERTLYGPGFILDELCGLSFRISSQSFYQVNSTQTEVLYRQAIKMAGFTGIECVIDAYCGTGTIGLVAAASGAAEVIGVDCVESSVRDARQNALHNGIENARFEVADAGAFLRKLAHGCGASAARTGVMRPYVLLMDPPRAGSTEAFLSAAAKLAPQRIVYISCNPETQVRDLRFLYDRGFELCGVQPVDMFPHTRHVECIAALKPATP